MMKSAFLLKNKRKTLNNELCLLFSQVFGLSCCRFYQREKRNSQEEKVEYQVCSPAHTVEDAAARAGYAVPETEQYQRDVPGKSQHQQTCCYQAKPPGGFINQEADGQQFYTRQQVHQNTGYFGWYGLIKQLLAEQFQAYQFAGRCIAKKNNKKQDAEIRHAA